MTDDISSLMRHDVPRKHRRRTRWPLRLTPPRCDVCGKQRAPGVDHDECEEKA